MAGRWMMASIQTTFAVMPALVYGVAGHLDRRRHAPISIGTLVAFTTLQTRLFFPVGSLLGVQADVQTSLALFERVFEYLDLPVDIDERPERDARPLRRVARRGGVRRRLLRLRGRPPDAASTSASWPSRARKVAVVGETGSGKTTLGYLAARLYDPTGGRPGSTATTCAT